MHIREPRLLAQAHRRLEVSVGFAREAGDDVGGNRRPRHMLADQRDRLPVLVRGVAAAHRAEHGVRSALQWNVEVGAEAPVRPESEQVRADVLRLH